MAIILDLPPELLELIFHCLGSVDDVHHLGRCWKKTYNIIKRPSLYVEIMRSVIKQSPQHRYDLHLCKMLDLHRKIVDQMQQNNSQLPATQLGQFVTKLNEWEDAICSATTPSTCCTLCCTGCLPDEIVYEVLARYQGLRVLENMWLERQLIGSDYMSADGRPDAGSLTESFGMLLDRHELYMDGELSSRTSRTPETAHYLAFNADQRARFHSAVTIVWLLNEIRWAFTNFVFPTQFNVQISLLEKCKMRLDSQGSVPLLDELDRYAVFKFMYHHLLPLYGNYLQDRGLSKLPFTFTSEFTKDASHTARVLQLFLTAGQTYFQPPDLIDLVVRSKVARKPPYPVVSLPPSTEQWHRPSQAFAFPAGTEHSLCDDRYKSLIQRASLTHLNVIARSSFHQHHCDVSPTVQAPVNNGLFALRDHASHFFCDRALLAFEMHENPNKALRNIRDVFPKMWEDELWSVWWWANGEDKARARMERWRVRTRTVGGHRMA